MKQHTLIKRLGLPLLLCTAAITFQNNAYAGPDQGKLLATHGVTQFDGAGGGGLSPWALITGGGTSDSWGANTHLTLINLPSYRVESYGVSAGFFDRLELSYTHQKLRGTSGPLEALKIDQDVFGAKVRLFGHAVYDQDTWIPQVSAGFLHHRNIKIDADHTSILPQSLTGKPTDLVPFASHDSGTEYYLAATKLFMRQSLLVNATLRMTKANQFGFLGFGSPGNDSYEPMLETSVAYLLNHNLAVGAEYRMKPNNLEKIKGHPLGVSSVDAEEDAWDIFVAWFPSKNVSLTAAYLDLGEILNPGQTALGESNSKNQAGAYLSLQVGF